MIEHFGNLQFSRHEMKKRLPSPIYKKWKTALYRETVMDRETADAMAHAMKEWALEKGATHYTHWFIPLTGLSAEKHNTFITKDEELPLLHFSGSSLIKGETDGSSFPTGGLRATFEARGFTYWDISSFAFVRGHVLYIPSIFISYRGDQLDLKSPLLRAVDSFNQKATELLHQLGEKELKGVKPMIGLEQEYFLVRKEHFLKRPDLFYTGRTLIGAPPPKGQEFEDHYLGSIPTKVGEFMQDVNVELWRLGIFAQCEHNESAPAQFEIVSHQEIASLSIDQNMLLMDVLKEKAAQHGFVCLLHEKPYFGINGSGKHNNISFLTSQGVNLLEPGESPKENLRFLLFLSAFILATEKHSTLLRLASSDAGNDERLGGFEAPPAIVSIYLGEDLHATLRGFFGEKALCPSHQKQCLPQLADLPADSTDRNRTSPIAFTGNKFEIRMLGSSRSAAMLNICLLAALADELGEMTEDLKAMASPEKEAYGYLTDKLWAVKHILYEGDGYSNSWLLEAKERGLPVLQNYVACIPSLLSRSTVEMFQRSGVLSEEELEARSHILYSQYSHTLMAEARTMKIMLEKDLLPALREEIFQRKNLSLVDDFFLEELNIAIELYKETKEKTQTLNLLLKEALEEKNSEKKALIFSTKVRSAMKDLRASADKMERLLPGESYPYPDYGKMLYSL